MLRANSVVVCPCQSYKYTKHITAGLFLPICRYSPERAVVIIMACIVLHNMAVYYKLPDPEDDEHDDNHDAELYGGQPALSARAERDSLVHSSFG